MSHLTQRRLFWRGLFTGAWLLAFLLGGFVPAHGAMQEAREDTWMQQAKAIGIALFSYATDNDQGYPDGKSSTEIFQKLIDGGYVTDPKVFYTPMPGKVVPQAGQRLKPENVCFDVTVGIAANSSDELPVVFSTGYKITYASGGSAVPLVKPVPPGLAVAYKSNSAKFVRPSTADGAIPHFIPTGFDAQGKT